MPWIMKVGISSSIFLALSNQRAWSPGKKLWPNFKKKVWAYVPIRVYMAHFAHPFFGHGSNQLMNDIYSSFAFTNNQDV